VHVVQKETIIKIYLLIPTSIFLNFIVFVWHNFFAKNPHFAIFIRTTYERIIVYLVKTNQNKLNSDF